MPETDHADREPRIVATSTLASAERATLIGAYEAKVYAPAFPDAGLREDPQYWIDLLDAVPPRAPPQPLIEVFIARDAAGAPLAGATVEYYRPAGAGLLTYLAVDANSRGQGLGRRLVAAARGWLDGHGRDVPMFAETERIEDAHDKEEIAMTRLRQQRLDGLGARLLDFTYVMPPLSAGQSARKLHLMCFPGEAEESVPRARVAALITELASALDADLDADAGTRAMMDWLEAPGGPIAVARLPAAA